MSQEQWHALVFLASFFCIYVGLHQDSNIPEPGVRNLHIRSSKNNRSALASRPARRGVDSFSGPLGGRALLISLFGDDRISYAENPKGSHVFF